MNTNKILIVMGMQNDFITGSLSTKEAREIVPYVKEEIETKRKEGYHVLYVRDTHSEEYPYTQEARELPIIHCQVGTDGWQIIKEIEDLSTPHVHKDYFLLKPWKDVFKRLGWDNPEEIEIIGTRTDVCVLVNIYFLYTLYPKINFYVKENCCAGTSVENHKTAIKLMKILGFNVT